MNQVAKRERGRANELAPIGESGPTFPAMSPALAAAVEVVREPYDEIQSVDGLTRRFARPWPELTTAALDEASALLELYDAALRAVAEPMHLAAWLTPLNVVVANPRDAESLFAFASSLLLIEDEIPLALLNADTRRKAARTWRHFPSGAEVLQLLIPIRDEWRATSATLWSVLSRGRRG